jgi:PAS domain S-box-containing protein
VVQPPSAHLVRFYEDDHALEEAVTGFAREGLAQGDTVLVIARQRHQQAVAARLAADGVDLARARASGRLVELDAHETLARLLQDGMPDPGRFQTIVGALVRDRLAAAGGTRLRAFGEMVDILWQRGDRGAALALEELWNDLQTRHRFTLLCAYAMGSFYKEPATLHGVSAAHTHVVTDQPTGEVARALAHEITHSREIESALRESLRELRDREQELRRRERQLRSLTDALPALVCLVDTDRRYQFVSAAYERWFGRPKSEIVGKTMEDVLGPSACETIGPYVDRALAGEQVTFEAEVAYKDGGPRAIEATYIPQLGEEGKVTGFVGLIADISERKQFEREHSRLHQENVEARARAEQLYHFARSVVSAEKVDDVFEAALDAIRGALGTERGAILIYDDAQVMRFRAWRQLSDDYRRAVEGHSPWPPDAVAPQPVLVPDVDADDAMKPYLPLFRREGIGSLAFVPLVTRGRLLGKFMVYYREPHSYSAHEIELATAIASHLASVTARFAAFAKLEETIRYNDLLAGILAHDLRNPLAAMMTAAQLLLMRQEGASERRTKPLSRILGSGQRMIRMIDQLLDVTRARAGGGIHVEPRPMNLDHLCGQAIAELEVAYPGWKLQSETVGDANGRWDSDRLLQVISNLVTNAGQHGDAGGAIRVRLDGREADSVTLEVHNDGVIPGHMLDSIFDPFRRVRERGAYSRGLGLGLFIVKEIVRAHGGRVEVRSSREEGTSFVVHLPRQGR